MAEINEQVWGQKRGPLGASGTEKKDSGDLSFQIENDALEVGLIEDLFVLSEAKEKRAATEIVDFARDAFGVFAILNQAHPHFS